MDRIKVQKESNSISERGENVQSYFLGCNKKPHAVMKEKEKLSKILDIISTSRHNVRKKNSTTTDAK